MAITEKELITLLEGETNIEKITTISDDGKNLLVRIPKKIKDSLKLQKGNKIRWIINRKKEIKIEIARENASS